MSVSLTARRWEQELLELSCEQCLQVAPSDRKLWKGWQERVGEGRHGVSVMVSLSLSPLSSGAHQQSQGAVEKLPVHLSPNLC